MKCEPNNTPSTNNWSLALKKDKNSKHFHNGEKSPALDQVLSSNSHKDRDVSAAKIHKQYNNIQANQLHKKIKYKKSVFRYESQIWKLSNIRLFSSYFYYIWFLLCLTSQCSENLLIYNKVKLAACNFLVTTLLLHLAEFYTSHSSASSSTHMNLWINQK